VGTIAADQRKDRAVDWGEEPPEPDDAATLAEQSGYAWAQLVDQLKWSGEKSANHQ
jgi:hypothetical protein